MADEKKKETGFKEKIKNNMGDGGVDYPDSFPDDGTQACLNYLRGGGDAVSAAHGAWELQGYALNELVGAPDSPAPAVLADPNATPPITTSVPSNQMRTLRLGVNLNQVHFGPVTHENLANQLESLCNQHRNFKQQGDNAQVKVAANGQWLRLLLPIVMQILQTVLGG
jgi:hypothetical protein